MTYKGDLISKLLQEVGDVERHVADTSHGCTKWFNLEPRGPRLHASSSMPFLELRDGWSMFDFQCPVCHATGELGARVNDNRMVECPNKCGSLFMVRRPANMFDKPVLEHVFSNQKSRARRA